MATWRKERFRRHVNERGAQEDADGFRLAARLLLVYALLFLWWHERSTGLAVANAVYALALQGLAAGIRCWRQAYVAHRESAMLGAQLVQAGVLLLTSLKGNFTLRAFAQHGGSPLRLLVTLLLGPPFFMAVTALHARLLLSWNVLALPALATLPLAAGPPLCRCLLAAPGAEAPLAALFEALETAHPFRSPAALLRPPVSPLPTAACLAVNAWAVLLCVAVLPLCALYPLERRARRQFWAQGVRAAKEAAEAAGASPAEAEAAARSAAAAEAPRPPQVGAFPLTGLWLLDLYLYSTATWALAVAAFARLDD